jgi:hypothetical protein
MSPVRRAELQARYECIQAMIAKAGSVRAAAKAAEMDRTNFRRLGRKLPILQSPAPATK